MLLLSSADSRSPCVFSFQQTRLWNSVKQSCNYTTSVRSRQAWNLSHQDKHEIWWKGDDKVREASTKEGYIKLLRSCETDVRCGILVGQGTIFIPRTSKVWSFRTGPHQLFFSEVSTTNYSGKDFGQILILSRREHSYWNIGPILILEPYRTCFFQSYLKALPKSLCPPHICTKKRLLAKVNVALNAEIKPLMTPDYSWYNASPSRNSTLISLSEGPNINSKSLTHEYIVERHGSYETGWSFMKMPRSDYNSGRSDGASI